MLLLPRPWRMGCLATLCDPLRVSCACPALRSFQRTNQGLLLAFPGVHRGNQAHSCTFPGGDAAGSRGECKALRVQKQIFAGEINLVQPLLHGMHAARGSQRMFRQGTADRATAHATQGIVRTSCPSGVTRMVCSHCAARPPSFVTTVHLYRQPNKMFPTKQDVASARQALAFD